MYTVKQWKHMFNELPEDAVVVISSDSEGNSFSPLSNGIGEGFWNSKIEEPTWEDEGTTEFDALDEVEKIKAVFLYPER